MPQSEPDCLTLNIWTPAADDQNRPVMVYIHGGGFRFGSGRDYYGDHLATRGNVVVVSFNYRVNYLGFSYIDDYTANVGLLDQILALQWVHDNIHLFGGDSENVTIFGNSAGAMAVSTLLAIPRTRGLFRRVIAQSGACNPLSYDPKYGKQATSKLLSELGIDKDNLTELQKISAYDFLEQARIQPTNTVMSVRTIPPYIHQDSVPQHPLTYIRNGDAANVDLLIGTNLNEAKLWNAFNPDFVEANDTTLRQRLAEMLIDLDQPEGVVDDIIEIYRDNNAMKPIQPVGECISAKTPQDILDAFASDLQFRIAAIRTAEAQATHNANTYMYLFALPSPYLNGTLGACHAMEIPFVFGCLDDSRWNWRSGTSHEAHILSEQMMDAWIAFAHTGNPNHPGLPNWPQYNNKTRSTMILHKECKVVDQPLEDQRLVWDKLM
jgi:para-nitrobenzyl esterase